MGVFKAILGMIGIGKGEPVLSLGTVASGQPAPDRRDDDDADSDDADSTRDGQLDIEDEWAELQMLVQRSKQGSASKRSQAIWTWEAIPNPRTSGER